MGRSCPGPPCPRPPSQPRPTASRAIVCTPFVAPPLMFLPNWGAAIAATAHPTNTSRTLVRVTRVLLANNVWYPQLQTVKQSIKWSSQSCCMLLLCPCANLDTKSIQPCLISAVRHPMALSQLTSLIQLVGKRAPVLDNIAWSGGGGWRCSVPALSATEPPTSQVTHMRSVTLLTRSITSSGLCFASSAKPCWIVWTAFLASGASWLNCPGLTNRVHVLVHSPNQEQG